MDKTRQKIIDAALEEISRSGLHATTKQIASRANINELTLFRHFGTKEKLVKAAIHQNLGLFLTEDRNITGNIEIDLQDLAKQYAILIDAYPGAIIAILSESNKKLVESLILPMQKRIANTLLTVMRFYLKQNVLVSSSEEDLVREFMGPLIARAFLARTIQSDRFDEVGYVQRFLLGHAPMHKSAELPASSPN